MRRDGTRATTPTGPLVWGEPGTNGQHAFFQPAPPGHGHHPRSSFSWRPKATRPNSEITNDLLLANCLAQSEALLKGRTLEEARAQLKAKGAGDAEADRIAPHRVFAGKPPLAGPSSTGRSTPSRWAGCWRSTNTGVFVEAALFGINAFDQWGVELGKELATGLLPVVQGSEGVGAPGTGPRPGCSPISTS